MKSGVPSRQPAADAGTDCLKHAEEPASPSDTSPSDTSPSVTSATDVSPSVEALTVIGAQENNLKNLSFSLRHNRLIAVTGLSGSGKSTLAIDTLYAEGGRRYIETFSPYTRQFLDRLHQPKLTAIHGIRPALALEQRNRTTSSRSTVGTVTEINDYLKILWAQHGLLTCPDCGTAVRRDTPRGVLLELERLAAAHPEAAFLITFHIAISGDATFESLVATLQREGFVRVFLRRSESLRRLDELSAADLRGPDAKSLAVVLDRLNAQSIGSDQAMGSIRQALTYGHGELAVYRMSPAEGSGTKSETAKEHRFSESLCCNGCGRRFRPPSPAMFTFNSPLGACATCQGFGKTLAVVPELIVPNPNKSIREGAIVCWNTPATRREMKKVLAFCDAAGIDADKPWQKLSKRHTDALFNGSKQPKFLGINGWFQHLQNYRHKMHVRILIARFRGEYPCATCAGTRLKAEASAYTIFDKTIHDLWLMPLEQALRFANTVREEYGKDPVTEVPLEEVCSRLSYLVDVGLGYLTLDRQTRTLSGGEHQRVNLTSLLGARLVNTLLVLDEPTIGLHQSDTHRLIRTVRALQERGNTVLVVEHDPEMIAAADEILDLGPGSGAAGGEIVYHGDLPGLLACKSSATGRALATRGEALRDDSDAAQLATGTRNGSVSVAAGTGNASAKGKRGQTKRDLNAELVIRGAAANNLKDIDVAIPLNRFVVLTGVSGSGKSSLLRSCLAEPVERMGQGLTLEQAVRAAAGNVKSIEGLDALDEVVFIDQHPIGKTPRANPATYTKAWEPIREALAATPDAERLGLGKSSFSFNVDGGRCPVCSGAGALRVEMQFLADVFVECEACGGNRFQDQVLTVRLGDKNVIDILELTLAEAVEFFRSLPDEDRFGKIVGLLQPLIDLGLGYVRLGHPLSLLSGGEAQRMKIASYLAEEAGSRNLFILDEPTTGLHPQNIAQLLTALRRLVERGHSVLVVEHNLDVIASADWILDLGPGAGTHGGQLVAAGSPHQLAQTASRIPASSTAQILARWHASAAVAVATPRPRLAPVNNSRDIEVIGARHHNLKNISVTIPQNTLTVVAGVSGSGKSTFAFDIVFAEGQRRYIDCLSPYARQYLKQLTRPDVDRVANIPPTVAISQRTSPPHGISTIATVTELYQFLRLLYAKVGTQHCPHDDAQIVSFSAAEMTEEILSRAGSGRIFLLAPVVSGRKGNYTELFRRALRAEITEARIDDSLVRLEPDLRLERHKLHWISLFVASITNAKRSPGLLRDAVEQALLLGGGTLELLRGDKHAEAEVFSSARMCPVCKRGYRELDPQDFSFRSARGVCSECEGRGVITEGTKRPRTVSCPACHGARIGPIGRHVRIMGEPIAQMTAKTAPQLLQAIERWKFPDRLEPVVEPILRELQSRLSVVSSVGLDYIQLDRDASTISGGEAQRLRLAKTLGSPLSGVCYVLDEPSIGLHPQDQGKLLDTLVQLRDGGNTVVVVEHDEDMLRAADHVIEIGPAGGAGGGTLVVAGSVEDVEATPESPTGLALRSRGAAAAPLAATKFTPQTSWIELRGARANNLRSLDVRFPIGHLTVVCGVSGAGKSSLVHGSLVPAAVSHILDEAVDAERRTWETLSNADCLDRMLEIDQSPAGKTSASTPASYLGIFDEIRKLFAALPESKARGYSASFFSCNTGKGRCPECNGRGNITVPMSFLPDATTPCDVCGGMRYTTDALEVTFQGHSIGELLQRTMSEARELFANHKTVRRSLEYVHELGLGYLTLGQPTSTLSGGETQRLKIARELGLREAERTLYVLDEPTIGLHMNDVDKLLLVLRKLIDRGNTVVLIEHNLDVIRAADYLIEVGPGPGDAGGQLLFSGSPAELAKFKGASQTRSFLLSQGSAPNRAVSGRGASLKQEPERRRSNG